MPRTWVLRRLLPFVGVTLMVAAIVAWVLVSWAGGSRRLVAVAIRDAVGGPASAGPDPQRDPAPASLAALAPETDEIELGESGELGVVDLAPREAPARPRGTRDVSYVLLLGVDRSSRGLVGRTDTIMLAAFRHRDGKVAAFGVPRDLWIEIPELRPARINAVMRIGELERGRGQGIVLLREVLERELGVRIDRYAAIDLEGFVALVDELGGIEVDVQCAIQDCFWVDGPDRPCRMLDVPSGRVHMDGATALMFVRSRHGTGERDRRSRQQAVLLAFARRVGEEGLAGLPALWELASTHVDSDLSWEAAAYYGSFALENELGDVRGFSVGGAMTRKLVTEDGKHVLLLEREVFDDRLAELFAEPSPALRERRRCPAADAALAPASDVAPPPPV